MPIASSTSSITGTCGERVSGTSSSSGPRLRGLLGDPVRLVRGDQVDPPLRAPVASMQATRSSGRWSWTSRAMKSSSPRTAFTGVPSGARTESGHAEIGAEVEGGGVEEHQASGHPPIMPYATDSNAWAM